MLASRRWRDWKAPSKIENNIDPPLPKLPKHLSGSFGSDSFRRSGVISISDHDFPHDPTAFRESVVQWLESACVRHPRCFSGVISLHRAYCDWELSHEDVPCPRETFHRLLQDSGFIVINNLVSGLILREDFEGVGKYQHIKNLLC